MTKTQLSVSGLKKQGLLRGWKSQENGLFPNTSKVEPAVDTMTLAS